MSFIPQITCRRCQRQFSGLRSRCPHCGTKKTTYSGRAPSVAASAKSGTREEQQAASNAKWQFRFGLILLTAVILAVMMLIIFSIGEGGPAATSPSPSIAVSEPPDPTPTPTPTPVIDYVYIYFYNSRLTEGFTQYVGDEIPLRAEYFPMYLEMTVVWSSTNKDVCTIDENGLVKCVGAGTTSISATVGTQTATLNVIIRER